MRNTIRPVGGGFVLFCFRGEEPPLRPRSSWLMWYVVLLSPMYPYRSLYTLEVRIYIANPLVGYYTKDLIGL